MPYTVQHLTGVILFFVKTYDIIKNEYPDFDFDKVLKQHLFIPGNAEQGNSLSRQLKIDRTLPVFYINPLR